VGVLIPELPTRFILSGQAVEILLPETAPTPAESNGRLVIYHHGSGENQTSMRTDTRKTTIKEAMLNDGYTIASSNAHGSNWGNPASVDDYETLVAYMLANYTFTHVLHLSQSMGGLSGLTTVAGGVAQADGWAGIYPACNLADIYGIGVYASAIDTAYGIPGTGDYATQTAGSDPVLRAASAFTGIPMRFYASPSDTVTPKATNSDEMAALVAAETPEETVVACTGPHGDASHFQPSDLLDFWDRCCA